MAGEKILESIDAYCTRIRFVRPKQGIQLREMKSEIARILEGFRKAGGVVTKVQVRWNVQ